LGTSGVLERAKKLGELGILHTKSTLAAVKLIKQVDIQVHKIVTYILEPPTSSNQLK